MKDLNAIIAKHEAPATAEPAPEVSSAPPAGTSEAGSAVADAVAPVGEGGSPTSPTATNDAPKVDHELLAAKLAHDRKLRAAKQLKQRAKGELDAAAKAKQEADTELARWKSLGKDQSFLDAIKAAGHDPREVYKQMQAEALKADTPAAQLEAFKKISDERIAALEKKLDDAAAEREERESAAAAKQESTAFLDDFKFGLNQASYAPLLEEYEPQQLLQIASSLKSNPHALFTAAKSLKLSLTHQDGRFTMKDIFDVMRATQVAHQSRVEQRRTKSAASHTSEVGKQPTEVKPTVNGTAERKAAPVTNNASEEEMLKGMSRAQRAEYLAKKYP